MFPSPTFRPFAVAALLMAAGHLAGATSTLTVHNQTGDPVAGTGCTFVPGHRTSTAG